MDREARREIKNIVVSNSNVVLSTLQVSGVQNSQNIVQVRVVFITELNRLPPSLIPPLEATGSRDGQ
eukprot:1095474-Amphidinium_carterae.1